MPTLITVLVVRLLGMAPWGAAGELGRAGELPQIIAFDGAELTGDHTHLVGDMRRLGKWEKSISSLIIVSGTWEFFDDDNVTGTNMATRGPGVYPRGTEKGLKDHRISSIRLVSPTARTRAPLWVRQGTHVPKVSSPADGMPSWSGMPVAFLSPAPWILDVERLTSSGWALPGAVGDLAGVLTRRPSADADGLGRGADDWLEWGGLGRLGGRPATMDHPT